MFWNQEAIDWIQKKFPKGLIDKEIEHRILPLNLTARAAFNHIKAKVKSEDVAQLEFKDIMKKHLDMKYKPNVNGTKDYFKYVTQLQDNIDCLNIGLSLSNEHVIACAMCDFKRSGHNKTHFAMFIAKWKTKEAAIDIDTTINDAKKFNRFQGHFNQKLKELYQHGDTSETREVANQAIDAKLTAIAEQQAKQDENMLQLHDNQLAARAETGPNVAVIPELVREVIEQLGTTTSGAGAVDAGALAEQVAAILAAKPATAATATAVRSTLRCSPLM